jgi:hypothetical protein
MKNEKANPKAEMTAKLEAHCKRGRNFAEAAPWAVLMIVMWGLPFSCRGVCELGAKNAHDHINKDRPLRQAC